MTVYCKHDRNLQQSLNLSKIFFDKALTFQNNYQYDSAIYYYKKEINNKKNDTVCLNSLIKLSNIYWWINIPDSAKYYYHITEKYYNFIKNCPSLFPFFLLVKGKYLQEEGKYFQSKLIRDSALHAQLLIVSTNDTSLARFYNDLGTSSYLLNNTDSAKIYYNKALQLAKRKANPDNMEALNIIKNLEIMYDVENNKDKARRYIKECVGTINRAKKLDYYSLLNVYYNFYSFYYNVAEYEEAFKYQNLRIEILKKLPDIYADKLYELYIEKSDEYADIKQYEIAMLCCEKADRLVYLNKNKFDFDLGKLYYQKGYILLTQENNYPQAINFFKACIPITKNKFTFHNSLIRMADCYIKIKQFDKGIEILKNELKTLDSTVPDNIDMSENIINWFKELTYLRLVKGYINCNDYNKAEKYIDFGLNLPKNYRYFEDFHNYFLNIKGLLLIKTGNYKKALEIYNKVIDDCTKDFLLASPSANFHAFSNSQFLEAAEGKARALYNLAGVSKNKNENIENLKNCMSTCEFLVDLTEKNRKRSFSENDNLLLGESYDSIYNNSIKTANLLYRSTLENEFLIKAFTYSDAKKAHVVSSNLNDTKDKRAGKIPDSLLAKEKNLIYNISYLRGKEREGILSEKEKSSKTEKLLVFTNELEKLISKFENEYPEYYWLKYNTKTVDIPKLFKQVGNEKALIEYSFTDDSLLTFVISSGKIHLVSQSSKGIEDSVLIFRKKLSYLNDQALTREGIKNYINKASWLYKILINPIEPYIHGKELIIVPDGLLSLLPFDAFVTSDSLPKQPDYGLLPYLLYKYIISYAYSAELYCMQQQMNSSFADGVITYAPEYKNFLYNRPGNLSKKSATIMLSPLRGSMEEAENITSIFGGKSITGNRATETTFKKNASENKILHLAMHTIIDNEFPMYSKLVFSATKDTTDDGFLNTYELYNLDLKTPLLVLSACNTGYGKLMKGEGIISLAHGFIYAGCPSMVITLWSVADRSSSDLMQLFYRNLNQKQNIDKSLQNAKIKYIQNSDQRMSHPYYWAGYIQTGKTIPVIKTKTHKLYVWPVAISIVIICFIGLVYFRKKSRNRSE